MKIKKYLSIAIGLLEYMEGCSHHHNDDSTYAALLSLEETLKGKGYTYQAPEPERLPSAFLKLHITDSSQAGLIAQVKCFPISPDESLADFPILNGCIHFTRSHTDSEGYLSLKLPVYDHLLGKYIIEISKGCEYEIKRIELCLHPDEKVELSAVLSPFIHLNERGWYAGDLHHHSIYSSPVYGGTDPVIEAPIEVARSMQSAGLRYGALSDHHNILNHPSWQQTVTSDFMPIISKEISTSNGHVLALNVPVDIIYHIPEDSQRTEAYLRSEFIRITSEIRSEGGLAQLNHPRDKSPSISLNPKFTDMIEIFDTMEIWNGSNPMHQGTTNYAALMLWLNLLHEGRYIPATSGSDTHNTAANDYNEMLDHITWLIHTASLVSSSLPAEIQSELTYLKILYAKTTPLLEKWAKQALGTGCVKTYVYLKKPISPDSVLESLHSGHSFLTNGPLLLPSINGAKPGETALLNTSAPSIQVELKANRPLKNLYLYLSTKKVITIPLAKQREEKKHFFDYSQILNFVDLNQVKWIIFAAADDCTNLALTNPIFLSHIAEN